jgi:serine protease AprX
MRRTIFVLFLLSILSVAAFSSAVLALDVSAPSINADDVWNQGITGTGVRVVVIDSGIDNHAGGPLADRVIFEHDFTNDGDPKDPYGHGTFVAGIIASTDNLYRGVAFGCQLINLKFIDSTGSGTLDSYTAAVDWCISNKNAYNIGIINLSAGMANGPCDGTCPTCKKAEEAVEAGIIFVAGAGNSGDQGSQTVLCPAQSFNVITVGACDDYRTAAVADDTLWIKSSKGPTKDNRPKPDVLAPGANNDNHQGLWSCRSLNAPYYFYELTNGDFARASGTSAAAPHVAGTVALMLQANPGLTPAQVKAILRQTARLNSHLSGLTVNERGYGIIDAQQAVYVGQHPILINPNLTFDEYSVTTPPLFQTIYYSKSFKFDVKRSSNGIDLTKLKIDSWSWVYPPQEDLFEVFESVKIPYVWIDGSFKNLAAYHLCLSSGPRVSDTGDGYANIRAQYRIGDVTVQLNYYVNVLQIQPWVLLSSSGSHTYNELFYLDPAVRGQDHDFAKYSNGTIIQNEIKLLNQGFSQTINVKDNPSAPTWPYLQCAPYFGTPTVWVLKNDGIVYSDPDTGINSPPESVYDRDIVLYYKYASYFGPWITIKYSS